MYFTALWMHDLKLLQNCELQHGVEGCAFYRCRLAIAVKGVSRKTLLSRLPACRAVQKIEYSLLFVTEK